MEAAPAIATTADADGSLPIHLAAAAGHAAVVQQLLEVVPAGATAVDAKGRMPIHLAAAKGYIAVV